MTGPQIGVLALQGDIREHIAILTSLGASVRSVRRPEELDGLDGILLPGGESTTIDRLARVFNIMDPLRTAIRGGLPAYGSCAGMILLADEIKDGMHDQQTIGGINMVVRRNAFGRQVDSFEGPVSIESVGKPDFHAVFIRAPWVESVGADVEVLGTVSAGEAMGRIVAVRQGNLIATSFHPELTDDHRVHGLFVEIARKYSQDRKEQSQ